MTLKELKKRIKEIKETAKTNSDSAHSMEDTLRHLVLQEIANGWCEDTKLIAKEVLKTSKIKFNRWCS